MPIDYKKYAPNWLSEIRPAILTRANDRCEFCKVENNTEIVRGELNSTDVYQDMSGKIYDSTDGKYIGEDYIGELDGNVRAVRIVLTLHTLTYNIENNSPDNLKALCQQCHNRYDKKNRVNNRKAKRNQQQTPLFEE